MASDNLKLSQNAVGSLEESLGAIDMKLLEGDAQKAWTESFKKFKTIQGNLSKSNDMKSLRENFSLYSDNFFVVIRRFGLGPSKTVYHLQCTMAFDYRKNQTAYWLQAQGDRQDQVRNPYRADMPTCAMQRDLILGEKPLKPKVSPKREK